MPMSDQRHSLIKFFHTNHISNFTNLRNNETQHPRRFPAAPLPLLVVRYTSCRPSASRTADLDTTSSEAFTPISWLLSVHLRHRAEAKAVHTQQLSSPHPMTRFESDRRPFAPKSRKANTRIIHRDKPGGVRDAIRRLSCAQPPTTLLLLQLAAAVVSFAIVIVVSSLSTEGERGFHEKPPKRLWLKRLWFQRRVSLGCIAACKALYKPFFFGPAPGTSHLPTTKLTSS